MRKSIESGSAVIPKYLYTLEYRLHGNVWSAKVLASTQQDAKTRLVAAASLSAFGKPKVVRRERANIRGVISIERKI